LLLKLRTVFFPVQTQFAEARSLWSVLQEKTACAARATAYEKARTRFQCLCSEKRGDTSGFCCTNKLKAEGSCGKPGCGLDFGA